MSILPSDAAVEAVARFMCREEWAGICRFERELSRVIDAHWHRYRAKAQEALLPAYAIDHAALVAEVERLKRALAEAREDAAYRKWRLDEIIPLFQESRDAIQPLTTIQVRLHGVSPTLADRMDAAGTRTREQFDAARAAEGSE